MLPSSMGLRALQALSETQKKRSLLRRMVVLHAFLGFCLLLIVARLLDLQVLSHDEFYARAQKQHFGGVVLPARRGEIFAFNSKTEETPILATNVTLDLIYVDPLITDNPTLVAETLADILVTPEFDAACRRGDQRTCPRELLPYYPEAFDVLTLIRQAASGSILEPLPLDLSQRPPAENLPDLTEVRRLFARNLEEKIQSKRVTFAPLLYGATREEMRAVGALNIAGITVVQDAQLIYANPETVDQSRRLESATKLASALGIDVETIESRLQSRPLRYVPVFRKVPPTLSLKVKQAMLNSLKDTDAKVAKAVADNRTPQEIDAIVDPLRSIALIPEHWRYYPDSTIASQVVGFLNTNQEAQYGIERTFDAILRGQEGLIRTVNAERGGQVVRADENVVDPKDGDSVVLTIDPFIQREVERILDEGMRNYQADSGQAIVMDPQTGRILAMANAPTFDRNNYGTVYEKEPVLIPNAKLRNIVVEIYHPKTNVRLVRDYLFRGDNVFDKDGRNNLPPKVKESLEEMAAQYDLHDYARYYYYVGEDPNNNARVEVFPTTVSGAWLRYRNTIGVGAYLNRIIQEIYEPGSVMKPVTMAVAIDKGEVSPDDTYSDTGPVEVDEYTIKNALLVYYGKVTMTDCISFSINTCMTSVSEKLGKKLFPRMLERFGFGRITGIELDDELTGQIPKGTWSNALLATSSFGQGISATPLQMITAFSALANGGLLMRPILVDSILRTDGTVEKTAPHIVDRVLSPETTQTMTAMLVRSAEDGFANKGKPAGYRIAGKTGTSQIAGPGGRYETGTGSNVNSFMGYAPVMAPRFVVLVKYDRPKFAQTIYAESTAAPTFKQIMAFLLKYYGIPPDDK